MPSFQYQARDKHGKILRGVVDGATIRQAASKLREDGVYITSLQPLNETKAKQATRISLSSRVKLKDLLLFTRQFSVMIRAGLNLVNCLNVLVQQTENQELASVINQIRRSVESGESLHDSLKRYPKIFPDIYINMVAAGEAGGQLEKVLERLAEHLEREFELRKKVVGAFTYPAIIVSVAILVVILLMTVVMPKFLEMFTGAGIQLPLMTRIVMATSSFLTHYWYLVILILGGTVFSLHAYKKTPEGKRRIDQIFFKFPIIGPVVQRLSIARFTRTLATLLESGLLIVVSLELVERAVGNSVVAGAIAKARMNITQGSSLATPLEETNVFPRMVTQLISVGEETGELPTMLTQVADFYEKEASYAVEALTAMIEPAIIICLGCVVAIIVASVMLPLFAMSTGATI